MLNNISLTPGEKTTVIGGRHNFVSVCHAPCMIRVLDKYYREIDRFTDVLTGLKFGNPEGIICHLEITNTSIYTQTISVYAGDLEVSGDFVWRNGGNSILWKYGVTAEYSYICIKNLIKKLIKVQLSGTYSSGVYIDLHDHTNISSGEVEANFYDLLGNVSSDVIFKAGSVTSLATAVGNGKLLTTLNSTTVEINNSFIIPPEYELVLAATSVDTLLRVGCKYFI